jgi:methyltransferase
MILAPFGLPQIAAFLILLQRGVEEIHSQRNTRALMIEGAVEVGVAYYPVVATTHLAWIAALAFLIPATATIHILPLTVYLVLQPVRYWIIAKLGPYWTHRIITLSSAPIITVGPYRFIHHPNYVVTLAETLLLPLAFGQVAIAFIFTAIWAVVLRYKIVLEDEALADRRTRGIASA